MGDQTQGCRGKAGIWAGITGLVVTVFLMVVAHEPFFVAVFLGLLTVVLFGAFLIWAFCSGTGAPGSADGTGATEPSARSAEPSATASDLAAPVSAFKAQSPEGDAARKQAESTAPAPAAPVAPAPAPAPTAAAAPAGKAEPAKAAAVEAPAKAAAKPAAKKPAAKKPAAKPAAAKKASAAKASAPKAASPAGTGQKPKGLKAPRASGADDLTKIEGIGPKLAETLNGWGVYHFDQIAQWGADEIAYADSNVPRFKGRCTRDKWVSQAKIIVDEGMEAFLERAKTNDY